MNMAKQLELNEIPAAPKKRGRKPTNPALGAKDPAARKRDQIARQWERIANTDCEAWTEADCVLVLTTVRFERGSPLDRGAWQQLGKLRGYM